MQQKALLLWSGVALTLHLALFAWDPDATAPQGGATPVAVSLRPVAADPSPIIRSEASKAPPPPLPPSLPPRPVSQPPVSQPKAARTPSPAKAAAAPREPITPPQVTPSEPAVSPTSDPAATVVPPETSSSPLAGLAASSPAALSPGPASSEPVWVEAHPRYDENPPPRYPRLAQQRGWEGEVRLRVWIAASGEVVEAEIRDSSGYSLLDRAALEAVRGWRFEPGRQGGVAVESQVIVPVTFRLRRS